MKKFEEDLKNAISSELKSSNRYDWKNIAEKINFSNTKTTLPISYDIPCKEKESDTSSSRRRTLFRQFMPIGASIACLLMIISVTLLAIGNDSFSPSGQTPAPSATISMSSTEPIGSTPSFTASTDIFTTPSPEDLLKGEIDSMYLSASCSVDFDGDGVPDSIELFRLPYTEPPYDRPILRAFIAGEEKLTTIPDLSFISEVFIKEVKVKGTSKKSALIICDVGGSANWYNFFTLVYENNELSFRSSPIFDTNLSDTSGFNCKSVLLDNYMLELHCPITGFIGTLLMAIAPQNEASYYQEYFDLYYDENGKLKSPVSLNVGQIEEVEYISGSECDYLKISQYISGANPKWDILGTFETLISWNDDWSVNIVEQKLLPITPQ